MRSSWKRSKLVWSTFTSHWLTIKQWSLVATTECKRLSISRRWPGMRSWSISGAGIYYGRRWNGWWSAMQHQQVTSWDFCRFHVAKLGNIYYETIWFVALYSVVHHSMENHQLWILNKFGRPILLCSIPFWNLRSQTFDDKGLNWSPSDIPQSLVSPSCYIGTFYLFFQRQ